MGMHDTITWVHEGEAPKCTAGHSLLSFQTKDRSWPAMDRYYIHGDKILAPERDGRAEAVVTRNGRLVLEQTTQLAPATESESLVLTTTCTKCDPVLSLNREWRGALRTEYPLQQFRLTISSGAVVSCTPIDSETTASLYEQQKRLGLRVVPIDTELYRELLEDTRSVDR